MLAASIGVASSELLIVAKQILLTQSAWFYWHNESESMNQTIDADRYRAGAGEAMILILESKIKNTVFLSIWLRCESSHRRSSQASLYLFLSRFSFLIYTLLYLLPLVKCRDYGIFAVWTFLGKLSGGFYGFLVRMASVCSLPLPTSLCDVWSMRNILIMPMRSCTIERP